MNHIPLVIIPDKDEPDAAQVFVDAQAAGRPYRFLLDTGAARSRITLDEYTSTLVSAGQHSASGVFAHGSADVITVPTLTLGPILKENVSLVRKNGSGPGDNNLIGMDILQEYCCHFLFDSDKVIITSVGASVSASTNADFQELLTDSKYHPYVPVRLGEHRGNAVWDTGASLTVVNIEFINKYPSVFQPVGQATGTDSTGAEMQTPMFLMAAATIGDHEFPPQRIAGVDLSHVNSTIEIPMDLILGYSLMRRANWLFDFPRKRWAISRFNTNG